MKLDSPQSTRSEMSKTCCTVKLRRPQEISLSSMGGSVGLTNLEPAALQYLLLRPAVFVLGRPQVKGRETALNRGPVLSLSRNHIDSTSMSVL